MSFLFKLNLISIIHIIVNKRETYTHTHTFREEKVIRVI